MIKAVAVAVAMVRVRGRVRVRVRARMRWPDGVGLIRGFDLPPSLATLRRHVQQRLLAWLGSGWG